MTSVPEKQRGFTLIELMIAVAIVGILGAIAVFMFNKATKKAKSTEVPAIFGEFKLRQEQHYIENNTYLSTGASDTDLWPGAPSGTDQATSIAPMPATWSALNMSPDKSSVYCGYVAIAGAASDNTNVGTVANTEFAFTPPALNWYYLLAECDWDDDSTLNSYYFAVSNNEGTLLRNEGY